MLALSLAFISLATASFGAPAKPTETYLFSANLTAGAPTIIGAGPLGYRVMVPVAGGVFKGPTLSGTVGSGTILSLTSSTNVTTAVAYYALTTTDGATILVTEHAHVPNVVLTFETGSATYAYLNNVTAYSTANPSSSGVGLEVWALGSL